MTRAIYPISAFKPVHHRWAADKDLAACVRALRWYGLDEFAALQDDPPKEAVREALRGLQRRIQSAGELRIEVREHIARVASLVGFAACPRCGGRVYATTATAPARCEGCGTVFRGHCPICYMPAGTRHDGQCPTR